LEPTPTKLSDLCDELSLIKLNRTVLDRRLSAYDRQIKMRSAFGLKPLRPQSHTDGKFHQLIDAVSDEMTRRPVSPSVIAQIVNVDCHPA
jgi:hypothetical protein